MTKDTVPIMDGTLIATRDHAVAEQSKNYRYSTNHQVVIDADTRLLVVIGQFLSGDRSDARHEGIRRPGRRRRCAAARDDTLRRRGVRAGLGGVGVHPAPPLPAVEGFRDPSESPLIWPHDR